jgi:hypothetical protein
MLLACVMAIHRILTKANRDPVAIVAELPFIEFDLKQFRCPE